MKAVAIRKGQMGERALAFKEMGTLRCDSCGGEYVVFHYPACVDKKAAEQQAKRLEKVLAEEHERERKHADRIQLPDWRLWNLSVNAFHEKAGRSQVVSWFLLVKIVPC